MNSISIRHLKQSLQHFFEHYDAQKEETVYAKFSTNLFTENRQKTAFYFQQIEQTFACLEQVEAGNLEALQFYSQKLSAQCTALSDALTRQQQNDQRFPRKTKEEEPEPADKRRHPVHRLPPRERLAKYYDYLASFNEKIQLVQDALEKAQHERQLVNKQTLKQLEQRRARCLEAIDVLEDYLVFMEKQK